MALDPNRNAWVNFNFVVLFQVVNLVLALAGRAGNATRSVLERLTFDIPGDDERFRKRLPPLQLQPLALSLPYLPRLRLLHVDGSPSADFLSAINPTVSSVD